MDLRTGKVKWQYPTEFPPRVSPLVTNGLVFAGYIFSLVVKQKRQKGVTRQQQELA